MVLVMASGMAYLERRDGLQAARATLESQGALVGRQYALSRASAALAMRGWTQALETAPLERDSAHDALASLALSDGDWLVLVDRNNRLVAARGISKTDWNGLGVGDGVPRFARAGQDTFLIETSVAGDRYVLYAGVSLSRRATRWSATPGVALNVSANAAPPVGLVLDQSATQTLSVTLAPPRPLLHSPVALFALAAAGIVMSVGLCWMWQVLLRRIMKRYWQQQFTPLIHAIARVRQGNCTEPLRAGKAHPLSVIAHEFNAMQDDIDERQSKVDYQSQFDALTGLMTRAVANERIARAVDRATFANQNLAAVAIDVSRFNEINGTLGQDVGDLVLKELAQRLSANTRVTDTVARVGGDEFMLLLDDVDDKTAMQLVEFLVSTLESPIVVREKSIKLKIRAGLALFPVHGEGPKALRRMANIALMTAKESQNKVVMYEAGQDEQQLRELAIIHDLPGALRDGELYLQYQPKIDVETQRVETVEALVRWRHPQLGFIPPDEFIGLLEKAGQISQLTDWVFKAAIRQVREWNAAGYDLGVAVNISANDLRDESLPARISALLKHYVVKPSRLSIEVTESAVIDDPERAVAVLQAFREGGLKIALDDFGTGQTSLSLLKQLPLSQVKIDKSFVQHLRADSGDAIIVKSIIDLGHNMGLLVTAEGVESNYCWNLLKSYECDLVQGYLVSAPLTADELCQWYLRLQERHVNKLDYSFLQNAG